MYNVYYILLANTILKYCVYIPIFFFSFRGVHGHFNGKRPWALGDECIVELMAEIVGKKRLL